MEKDGEDERSAYRLFFLAPKLVTGVYALSSYETNADEDHELDAYGGLIACFYSCLEVDIKAALF